MQFEEGAQSEEIFMQKQIILLAVKKIMSSGKAE